MNKTVVTVAFLLLNGLTLSSHAQGIKCWINANGDQECGNSVPEEYSQKGYRELNQKAIEVGKTPPAKTEAEIAELKRQEAQKQEEERQRKIKEEEDRKLLDLFSSEDDIRTALDARLRNIALSSERIQTFIQQAEKNQKDMENSLTAEGSHRLTADEKEKIKANIVNSKKQIADNRKALEQNRDEESKVRTEFEAYLSRFQRIEKERAEKVEKERVAKEKEAEASLLNGTSKPSKVEKIEGK